MKKLSINIPAEDELLPNGQEWNSDLEKILDTILNEQNIKLKHIKIDEQKLVSGELIIEVTIKGNGIWRLNKTDADNWPSNLHGHNLEKKQKIDFYTGEIFDINTKKLISKLRKKQLNNLHIQLNQNGINI